MIAFKKVIIVGADSLFIKFDAQGVEEIYQNLMIIYTTPIGTVPYDREFGIDISFLDQPIHIARGMITMEYTEKTLRYEPRAAVSEVHFDQDELNGELVPRVVIELVG